MNHHCYPTLSIPPDTVPLGTQSIDGLRVSAWWREDGVLVLRASHWARYCWQQGSTLFSADSPCDVFVNDHQPHPDSIVALAWHVFQPSAAGPIDLAALVRGAFDE